MRIWGIQVFYDWDWSAADASVRGALELEPGRAEVLRLASIHVFPMQTFGGDAIAWREHVWNNT